jgi:hypothetical protein
MPSSSEGANNTYFYVLRLTQPLKRSILNQDENLPGGGGISERRTSNIATECVEFYTQSVEN